MFERNVKLDMMKSTNIYRYNNMVIGLETKIEDYFAKDKSFFCTFQTYKNVEGYMTSILSTYIERKRPYLLDKSCEVLLAKSEVRWSESALNEQHEWALSQYDSIRRKAIATVIKENAK